ncbi:MAG: ABC transporter ATP-binding protein [Gammaproteobacteria bacterium]|nr:ABC transporter ATP-binding protein [Gammaproteobacteria bacterium]
MIIRTEGLNKSFRRHSALHGVSLSVPEGSMYALIGPNGAGKTTTIRTLMNILLPTSGRAEVFGVDSRRLSPTEFAQIGYVAESQELPSRLTVSTYLAYLRPFYSTWDNSLERTLVSEFQLPRDRVIKDLSHGMRMKVRLASALCYRPKLLVMDEPFSGLDPMVRDELMQILLQQAQEMTVFVSSHELDEIEASTTYVGYLENGKLLFQESMATLVARVREVRITLLEAPRPPPNIPSNWLNLTVSGNVVSFVDIGFSQNALHTSAHALFSGIQDMEVQPAALRSIFVSLARASRDREAIK